MPEVKVIRKEEKTKPGFSVGVILNRKVTKGQIGIEIELEGKNLPHEDDTPAPWNYTIDHSLRGEDNGEYVLARPIDFDKVPKALEALWNKFGEFKSSFDDSNRTSVHIHLNVQDFHLNRLTTFMASWFALEEILVEFCGEHRVGNLFCLRAVDAPAIINHLRKFIKTDGEYQLHDMLRYAGLNPNALFKYGSIEIRTLRGCKDPDTIQTWVDICKRLYDLSGKYEDPRELVALYSSGGPLSFFETLLGDLAPVVRGGISWDNEQVQQAMFRGIRFAQDLAYCRDWGKYKPLKLVADPFGRDTKKIAAKLASEDSSPQVGFTHQDIPVMSSIPVSMVQSLNEFNAQLVWAEPDYEF
jgi:hypothetical protein